MSRTKKFKMTDLGPIPEDWEIRPFGNCWSRFATGPFGSALHKTDYVWGGTPIVNPMHIANGTIEPDLNNTVSDETLARLSSYVLREGDLVMGRRGEMGRVAVVSKAEDGWLCGTGSFSISLKREESPDYIALYLRTPQAVSEMEQAAIGTTMTSLNHEVTSSINIVYPPLPEQRRIAAALSDADELIAALTELLEKKRNLKQGAMQQLLTGKRRLPGFKGKWVEKEISELGDNLGGGTPSTRVPEYWKGTVPWLSSSDLEENEIRVVKKTRYISNEAIRNSATCICPKGTLHVITRVGVGKVAVADEDECTSQDFTNIILGESFDVTFCSYLLSRTMISKKEEVQGTSIKGISVPDFLRIEITLPPTLEEQRAIAEVLTDMDEEIARIEAELEKAKNVKTGMMQQLLTGKVRLDVS